MNHGNVPLTVFPNAEALGAALAEDILAGIDTARKAGKRFILGCPGGRSLRSTYQALGALARTRQADLSKVVIAMMDDYVERRGETFFYCPPEAHYSCRRFAHEEIRDVLNKGLPTRRRIPIDQVWFPDPAMPPAYDEKLRTAGVDLFLIASGATDGHVAFNPIGTTIDSGCRVIPLDARTRQDNLKTFPKFAELDEVPAYGVSVGLGTISRFSRRVILVIHGVHKQEAVRQLLGMTDFSPKWPASVIYRCQQPQILLDQAAAPELKE